jgi:ABC-type uncharacterized transport system permease subunit
MKKISLWRVAYVVLICLGLLYIISDLVYDFFGIEWFLLKTPAHTTMIYGCFLVTWGVLIWSIRRKR